MTRADFISGKVKFQQYYLSVLRAADIKLDGQHPLVKRVFRIYKFQDVAGRYNAIPPREWLEVSEAHRAALRRAFKEHGDTYSDIGAICAIKTAVREVIDAMKMRPYWVSTASNTPCKLESGELEGYEAIEYAAARGIPLQCYANPLDGGGTVTVEQAREIAREDPRLIYVVIQEEDNADEKKSTSA